MTMAMTNCDGCGKRVDMYYCSRTFAGHRWHFFCEECARSGKNMRTISKETENDENKSGAE